MVEVTNTGEGRALAVEGNPFPERAHISALALPLAACAGDSSGGSSGEDVVEIDFFHRWPNEPKNAYFAGLV